jgi:hypothetical protein
MILSSNHKKIGWGAVIRPDVSKPTRTVHRTIQFDTRTLMLITLVTALCGAVFQASVVVGSVASFLLVLALFRTLAIDANRRGYPARRRGGMLRSYCQSCVVVCALVLTAMTCLVVAALVSALYVLHLASRIVANTLMFVRDHVPRRRRFAAFTLRATTAVFQSWRELLTFVLLRMVKVASWLHHTSRTLGRMSLRRESVANPVS